MEISPSISGPKLNPGFFSPSVGAVASLFAVASVVPLSPSVVPSLLLLLSVMMVDFAAPTDDAAAAADAAADVLVDDAARRPPSTSSALRPGLDAPRLRRGHLRPHARGRLGRARAHPARRHRGPAPLRRRRRARPKVGRPGRARALWRARRRRAPPPRGRLADPPLAAAIPLARARLRPQGDQAQHARGPREGEPLREAAGPHRAAHQVRPVLQAPVRLPAAEEAQEALHPAEEVPQLQLYRARDRPAREDAAGAPGADWVPRRHSGEGRDEGGRGEGSRARLRRGRRPARAH